MTAEDKGTTRTSAGGIAETLRGFFDAGRALVEECIEREATENIEVDHRAAAA